MVRYTKVFKKVIFGQFKQVMKDNYTKDYYFWRANSRVPYNPKEV